MSGMTKIVKTITRPVKVLIIMFGVYITLTGHLSPGGGFAGGVILASAYILLMLAYGRRQAEDALPLSKVSKLDCIGALAFAMIAVAGYIFGGGFFVNFLSQFGQRFNLLSSGTIPLSNIAIGLKVGASLFLVIFLLSAFRYSDGDADSSKE